MNLVLIVIFVETIILFWLAKEIILACHNFNIFDYLVDWIKNRPTVLPSLLFFIFPFLAFFSVDNLSVLPAKYTNDKILSTWLTTIATSMLTAFGLFLNNRYSEKSKDKREQQELSNILICIIGGHLKQIKVLKDLGLKCSKISQEDLEKINNFISFITSDALYRNTLLKIGFYELSIIKNIIEYDSFLILLIDEFKKNIDNDQLLISLNFMDKYEILMDEAIINSHCLIMRLSKLVINDEQKYQESKEIVKQIFLHVCERAKRELFVSENFEFEFRRYSIRSLASKDLLNKIILVYKELGILNELRRK